MIILAIETSCDETSAAVLDNERVLSNIISTQLFHSEFGGVVPEAASREHLKKIIHVTNTAVSTAGIAIRDVDYTCATTEPGLIGALLVGSNFAKGISSGLGAGFIPVNHIHAHLYSPFIGAEDIEFPYIGLIVSGGHTLLVLAEALFSHKIIGRTIDDAAGEAFDKVAKMLGLGYPGGMAIDQRAGKGDPAYHSFPKSVVKDSEFDFSFSGIKTSVLYFLRKNFGEEKPDDQTLNDICASFQKTMVEMLYEKTLKFAEKSGVSNIAISGGVSANSELRAKFENLRSKGFKIFFPELQYISDNAAMIGYAGYLMSKSGYYSNELKSRSLKKIARPRLIYAEF